MIYELILYVTMSADLLPDAEANAWTLRYNAVASRPFTSEKECNRVGEEWASADPKARAWKCWGGATQTKAEF